MNGLTDKQQKILTFIEEFPQNGAMAPTIYEIAEHFQIKTSTAFAHVRALQRKKRLTRSNKARSIALSRPDAVPAGIAGFVPLLASLKAGVAIAEQKAERQIMMDFRGFGPVKVEQLFAVRTLDDSMCGLGIYEDDLVIAEEGANLRSGDLVVVLAHGEMQVKSYFPLPGTRLELRSASPDFPGEVYDADRVCIVGKVVGCMRFY